MQIKLAAAAVLALATVGPAQAQAPSAVPITIKPPPYIRDPPGEGYLKGPTAPDTVKILPPAPTPGTSRYEADRTIFLQSRWHAGSPRWAIAQADVEYSKILKPFACALGVDLTPANAPKFHALMVKMKRDVSHAQDAPKEHYMRKRPYLIDKGVTCVETNDGLSINGDYPSGHTTWGWTVGLVLTELAPEKASEILTRARAYGESRLYCGVHNLSAVEAGRTTGAVVVAALHGSAQFRKDLDGARKEIAAARKAGPTPDPAACAAEAEMLQASPY